MRLSVVSTRLVATLASSGIASDWKFTGDQSTQKKNYDKMEDPTCVALKARLAKIQNNKPLQDRIKTRYYENYGEDQVDECLGKVKVNERAGVIKRRYFNCTVFAKEMETIKIEEERKKLKMEAIKEHGEAAEKCINREKL